jgi:hypothetical protein
VLGLSIVSLSVIFLLDFGTVPTVWYILFFTLLGKLTRETGVRFPVGEDIIFYQPFEALIEETQPFRFIERWDCSGMETRHP